VVTVDDFLIIVRNEGKKIAENCEASITFEKTNNNRQPSIESKI
jgi:hypothetical protein